MEKIKSYLRTWSFFRLIRLIAGVSLAVFGWVNEEWLVGGLGAGYALMTLIVPGCVGNPACSWQPKQYRKNKS